MQERILCSAIWYKDLPLKKTFVCNVLPVNCDRGLVFCGLRHVQCLYSMCSITGLRSCEAGRNEEGFLTNLNRFVDRKEGALIAFSAGQIAEAKNRLFSEDLY